MKQIKQVMRGIVHAFTIDVELPPPPYCQPLRWSFKKEIVSCYWVSGDQT